MSSPAPSPAGRTGLWTKNFTLLTVATVLGAAGGIAGNFALSFLVYDQTGSIFASALLLAIQILSVSDEDLAAKLDAKRASDAEKVLEKDAALQL